MTNQEFIDFRNTLIKRFESFDVPLVVDADQEVLWEIYLQAFPEEQKQEHNCNSCKSFIRRAGNIVAIENGKKVSIWDVEIDSEYQKIADAMNEYVTSMPIDTVFKVSPKDAEISKKCNDKLCENSQVITWQHMYLDTPNKFISSAPDTIKAERRTTIQVLKRAAEELSIETVEIVYDLLKDNQLYRASQYIKTVTGFLKFLRKYKETENKEALLWGTLDDIKHFSTVRNSAIGTLMVDIESGIELNNAVKSYDHKVAPSNYKRPKAIFSAKQVEQAEARINELELNDALERRFANAGDIDINDLYYINVDSSLGKALGVFEELKQESKTSKPDLKNAQEIHVDEFLNTVVPNAKNVEVFVDNLHRNNFVSLIAPIHKDANRLFAWNNNFSWGYPGDVAGAIRKRVEDAGGKVSGKLRVSLSWFNTDDLDLHIQESTGTYIYYRNKQSSVTKGTLDVDMNVTNLVTDPVENIIYEDDSNLIDGEYEVKVHNYRKRNAGNNNAGFVVEIEYDSKIFTFRYSQPVKNKEKIHVATLKIKNGVITLDGKIPKDTEGVETWNIKTMSFVKVTAITNSPNYWGNSNSGDKQYFFFLEDCKNPETPRGFFNEFLRPELRKEHKVFEALGNKLRVQETEDQLSGLGFSASTRNEIIVKVTNNDTRLYKVNF